MGDIISGYLNSLPEEKGGEEDVLDKAFGELMERIKTSTEAVDSPAHYGGKDNVYEAINVIEAYDMGFLDGNVLKYLLRYRKKNGLEDLKKAKWYLERLISQWEKK
jgi:hypothetical protein